MQILVALLGILAVAIVLRDSFETIILPRRVSARFRVSKIFYRATWRPWKAVGRRLPPSDWRETFLSTYGPLSLIGLFVLWGGILIAGFSALLWAAGFDVNLSGPGNLYVSGTTFTTLGIGDFTPRTQRYENGQAPSCSARRWTVSRGLWRGRRRRGHRPAPATCSVALPNQARWTSSSL